MAAVTTAQPQKAARQDAAFGEGVELVLHELRQVGAGLGLGFGKEGCGVLLNQTLLFCVSTLSLLIHGS